MAATFNTSRFIAQPSGRMDGITFAVVDQDGRRMALRSGNADACEADVADMSDHNPGKYTMVAVTPDGDVPMSEWEWGMGRFIPETRSFSEGLLGR
jgi:hypothetical protein